VALAYSRRRSDGTLGSPLRRSRHRASGGDTVIGRDAECHVALDDGLASRRHDVLHVSDARVMLEDLGSRNGTTLDGRLIGAVVVAGHLSKVTIGGTTFTIIDTEKQRARAHTVRTEVARRSPSGGVMTGESSTAGFTSTAVPDLASVERARDALVRGAFDECAASSAIVARRQVNLGVRAHEGVVRGVSEVLVGLARRTGDRGWLDGVFQVHAVTGRMLPGDLADQIAELPAKGSVKHVREYVEMARARSRSTPAELRALERLEKLSISW
jgi:hypothetical protein